MTTEGVAVRYTARDRELFALLERGAATATLTDLVATPTTAVTAVDGTPREWEATPEGIRVHLDADTASCATPVAVRAVDVAASPSPSRSRGS